MLKELLVIHDNGKPVYTFFTGDRAIQSEVLLSGFVAAIQSFAAQMLESEQQESIQSIKLAQRLVLTFRPLTLQKAQGEAASYYFVLLTEAQRKQVLDPETLLEYLILSFLGFRRGLFLQKMREESPALDEFRAFDGFLTEMTSRGWETIKKKTKPIPASLIQGMLNELRDYIPLPRILELHPKIVRLGASYGWLSDDLTRTEEEELLAKIEHMLSRLFGPALYDSLVAKVAMKLKEQ